MVDVFLAHREEFGIFVTYIGGYDHSMALLEESCRRSKAFADIIKRFEVRTGCEFSPSGICKSAALLLSLKTLPMKVMCTLQRSSNHIMHS